MTKPNRLSRAPLGPIEALVRSPLLWGALATCGFYWLTAGGTLASPFIRRYFASHPVEYIMTAMFFIGMAALGIKVLDIARQHQGLGQPLLAPPLPGGRPVTDCQPLAARLDRLPRRQQRGYRVGRVRDALEYVRRTSSAEALGEHLKYLADRDADRAYAGYGMVRMFIWAIPILGFLGTVIGIAQAMGNLAPQALENSLPEVMAGLTVAFDTTKLALGLCIVLFFAQFLTDREENKLLARVDERVDEELIGHFEHVPHGPDGQLVAVRRMIEALVGSSDHLVRRQAELWQASLEEAGDRWTHMADTAGKQLQAALSRALAEGLKLHAQEVAAATRTASEENRWYCRQVHQTLSQTAETVTSLQQSVIQKAEVLGRAVEATGEVAKLQQTLNQNLRALAGAKNFEQTVVSLAAVLHLLTARLGELPAEVPQVELDLDTPSRSSQAA